MKKIGIVGGIGWPSTMEYYRLICEASQRYHRDQDYSGPAPMPEIVIESLNMHFTVNHRGNKDPESWRLWDDYFKQAILRLEQSGAEIIVLASVTPHARLDELSTATKLPIISLYDAVGSYCRENSIKNLLVLGTLPTMTNLAFSYGLEPFDVRVTYPASKEVRASVLSIIESLYNNNREGIADLVEEAVRVCAPKNDLCQPVACLACTELPLAFDQYGGQRQFVVNGIRYLNSTVIHARSVFEACVVDG